MVFSRFIFVQTEKEQKVEKPKDIGAAAPYTEQEHWGQELGAPAIPDV